MALNTIKSGDSRRSCDFISLQYQVWEIGSHKGAICSYWLAALRTYGYEVGLYARERAQFYIARPQPQHLGLSAPNSL